MHRRRFLQTLTAASAALAAPPLSPAIAAAEADAGSQARESGGRSWSVTSPDGRLEIGVTLGTGGALSWRVTAGRATVLAPSPLGLRRHDQPFLDGLRFVASPDPTPVDERYEMPHGKRRQHVVSGRERVVSFANAAGAKLDVILRAHDDGVAFRYRFPETDATPRRLYEERTGFAIPAGSRGWMLPHQPPGRYTPAYEDLFREVRAGTTAPDAAGWSLPALFETPGGTWLLITEADLHETYAGARLAADAPRNTYRIAFPQPGDGMGTGEVDPVSTLPWTMPWRVVIVGRTAADLLASDLVHDLSAPSTVKDPSWIEPGRAAWSWWSASDSPKHAEALNAFTDLAAEMGWEYALVDANWNAMESGRIEDVIAHARSKDIGLLFWYNSGGPHNDVTEAPRDRMDERPVRREEMERLRSWGVKGIKVDFWHSDKPDRIRHYRDLLEDAAEFHLLVDFHGCTLPRGWSREFPHLMSMEAVAGAEQYKFNAGYPERAPAHNTMLAFTRNVVGPMDYTPVTFSNTQYPHRTTNAHELALAVVFESGLLHLADSVESYRAQPEAVRAFLRGVPAAWDDTRGLWGRPGESVALARRHDRTWYVGALNAGGARTEHLDLSFLGDGSWTLTLIRDGADDRSFADETRTVTAGSRLPVALRANGGFVARVTPEEQVRR
jgi:hypothetical protein